MPTRCGSRQGLNRAIRSGVGENQGDQRLFLLNTGVYFRAKLIPTLFIWTWPNPTLWVGIFIYGATSSEKLLLMPASTPNDKLIEEKR